MLTVAFAGVLGVNQFSIEVHDASSDVLRLRISMLLYQ